MGLGRHKLLLDDRYSTNGTHHPLILTTRILGAFQRVTMAVGNNGGGVHNVVLDTGNDGVGVGDIMADARNDWICVDCKRLLETGS